MNQQSRMHSSLHASIDVETADNNRSSICQVGVVIYEHGEQVETYETFVDPRVPFGIHQTRVHGLSAASVAGAPTWPIVAGKLRRLLDGMVLSAHSMFDKQAVEAANALAGLPNFNVRWLNTVNVLPRAWPDDFNGQPCGLQRVAQVWGVKFQHHDALADAKMSGLILARACRAHGLTPEQWLLRCNLPVEVHL
ncbi:MULTISPECIES: exonuclease domain-containing protein [Stenotrophomonas]|uniref:exonuclease domain-containing protein n=1 Tax=Stenotrophomonas TaxID=40323 RepID=UPI002DB80E98|nr:MULTISPECIES: exonuclease domain-containing protein [Stenotrophomonas]MEC4339874.1 exonuclease domain-containing protein [Stenotrophomonas pavanii]